MASIWDEFRRMQDQIDSLFGSNHYLEGPTARQPIVDMHETDKEIIAHIELPGAEKDDIDVHVTAQGIEVSVQKETEIEDDKDDSYRYERRNHRFYRHIPLPDYANKEKVDATYANGILTVKVPNDKTMKRKRIEVKS